MEGSQRAIKHLGTQRALGHSRLLIQQTPLKCNISRKKWMMKFVFGMQINIKVFYKFILSFWLCVARHAQSAQHKYACLCNISRKTWGMNLIFCLWINTKVFCKFIVSLWLCVPRYAQSNQCNEFPISLQHLKENIKDEVYFFCLQINMKGFFKLILSFRCPSYPK